MDGFLQTFFLPITCLVLKVFILNLIMKQTKMPGSVQAIMIFSCISPPTLLFNLGTFQVYMQREVMFELSLEYGGKSGGKNASNVMSTRKKSVVQITIRSTLLPWCEMAKRSISYFFFLFLCVFIYLFIYARVLSWLNKMP